MLGIQADPKLAKIREQNPLNKIAVPQGLIANLDERIGQFYIPVDPDSEHIHPLLSVTNKGLNSTIQQSSIEQKSPGLSHRKRGS